MEDSYYYKTEVEWTGERHGDLSAPVLPSLQCRSSDTCCLGGNTMKNRPRKIDHAV